jgi:tetratricopeptide (TPR) repeat protein/predicted Ser/Thr protein kinase
VKFETAVPLGRGATGEVLKAWDPRLERWVALKFLRSDDPSLLARMQREARLQARLRHPNVAEVYDVGEWEGRPYIAMQLIEGVPLDQAVRDLSLEQRVRLLAVVAHAVHAAHAEGLIHRDLKPGNIMVEPGADGTPVPYVLDFGIAREAAVRGETVTGQMLGTPGYLSPEQARGETARLDRRSDVFSLGAVLYEVLTGARPFGGDSPVDALVQVLERDPLPPRRRVPGLPRDLETIVLKCLEKDPDRRYGSARELAEDLERFLCGDAIAARPRGPAGRLARRVRRHPVAAGLAAAAGVALLALAAVALHARLTAAARADAAQRFGQRVEQMEATLRYAHLLPLHDVKVERARVRRMLEEVAAELPRLPPAAAPAARYALGRGHLALDRPEEARRELRRAWDEGFRTPQAAYALGLALGQLYEEELDRAAREPDPKRQAEIRTRAHAGLAAPALASLRAGGRPGALPESAFVEARIAYLEERWEDALRLAGKALASTPWLYEAELLAGAVHQRRASLRQQAGDWKGALAWTDRASEAFERAVRLAPSSEAARSALCELSRERLTFFDLGGFGVRPDLYAEMERLCRAALAADSSAPRAYRGLVGFFTMDANRLQKTGQDAMAALTRALELSREAERRGIVDPEILHALGSVHLSLADEARARGEDPKRVYDPAKEHLRRASELFPEDPRFPQALGYVLLFRMAEEEPGSPAVDEDYARAEKALLRAIELGPPSGGPLNGLAMVYIERGRSASRNGENPRSFLDKAAAALSKAVAIEANPIPYLNLAIVHSEQALYEIQTGGDPAPHFERCIEAHDRGLAVNADFVASIRQRGHCRAELLGLRLDRGLRKEEWRRAEEELRLIEADAARVAELYPGPRASVLLGAAARLAAAVAALRGESPLPHAERAVGHLEEALARGPVEWANLELARTSRDLARYKRAAGRDASRDRTRAAAAARAALAEEPLHPEPAKVLSEVERSGA